MARSGSYRGVPLFSLTNREPNSVLFVPVGRGLMQPYERVPAGELCRDLRHLRPSVPLQRDVEVGWLDSPQSRPSRRRIAGGRQRLNGRRAGSTAIRRRQRPAYRFAGAARPAHHRADADRPECVLHRASGAAMVREREGGCARTSGLHARRRLGVRGLRGPQRAARGNLCFGRGSSGRRAVDAIFPAPVRRSDPSLGGPSALRASHVARSDARSVSQLPASPGEAERW